MKRGIARSRIAYAAAGVLLLLYCANVALRLDHIKFGASIWSVGDVGEFLLVLVSMVCFVAGLLIVEASNPKPKDDATESTTGDI